MGNVFVGDLHGRMRIIEKAPLLLRAFPCGFATNKLMYE